MLSEKYDIKVDTARKMVNTYENYTNFVEPTISKYMSKKIVARERTTSLVKENAELRKQLQHVNLKLDGCRIIGDILEQEHGIDLLEKSEDK